MWDTTRSFCHYKNANFIPISSFSQSKFGLRIDRILSLYDRILSCRPHENAKKAQNLIGLAGLFFYTFICILLSKAPYKINWRPVLWGYFTQLVLGILVLRTTAGYIAFKEDFSIQNCSMITTRGHQGSKWTVQAKQKWTLPLRFE